MKLESEHRSTAGVSFIRTGETIYIAAPNHSKITHPELSDEHALEEMIGKLKGDTPSQIDMGIFSTSGNEAVFLGNSSTYELPLPEVALEAREITRQIAQTIFGDDISVDAVIL